MLVTAPCKRCWTSFYEYFKFASRKEMFESEEENVLNLYLTFRDLCLSKCVWRYVCSSKLGSVSNFETHLCHTKITYLLLSYLLTHSLTYSMQQSPSWEVNRFSASQEIPHFVWNPKVHYHIHKCSPTVPILSQLNPVHTPTSHFLKIHFNNIFPSTPGSPKWPLSTWFPQQTLPPSPLPFTHYMSLPYHASRFNTRKCRVKNTTRKWHSSTTLQDSYIIKVKMT